MKLKNVRNYSGEFASMLIYSEIGDGAGEVNGFYFAEEMNWLGRNGVTNVDVHINSGGGGVLHAFSILAAIRNFPGNVNTIIDGVAASSAGWVALGGRVRKMVDFGRIMIHNPTIKSGTVDESTKKTLENVRQMLLAIFENNSNFSPEKLDELMEKESWVNADEAISSGLIDEIVSTKRELKDVFSGASNIAEMVNAAGKVDLEKIINTNNNKMLKIKNHLNLDAKSGEDEALNAIVEIQNAKTEAEGKVLELQTDFEALEKTSNEARKVSEEKIEALKKEVASVIVDSAILAGKFKAEKRESLIETATNDLEAFKTLSESISENPSKITDEINFGDNSGNKFEGKTFREIEKAEGGEAFLNALKVSNKAAWEKLFNAEYSA